MKKTRLRAALIAGSLFALVPAPGKIDAQTSIRPSAAVQSGSTNRRTSGSGSSSATTSTGPRQYRSNTVLGDAVIQTDPESRSLVIVADEDTHAEIMKVLRDLDKPKPQVLIKVLFVEVTYNKDLDLGLEGGYNLKIGHGSSTATSTGTATSTTTQNTTIPNGTNQSVTATSVPVAPDKGSAMVNSLFGLASQGPTGTLLSVLTSDYQATLRAIASNGHINVLSRPSIMARNNQEAVIVVGQEVPFVTNSQITSTGQTLNTIQYNDVGIILRVTPFISSNRTVEMIVAPEISTVSSSSVTVSNGITSPLIDKRSAETVVVTPNATTVVIGGLMQTQRTETLQKVPFLGDIPILGLPFRHIVKGNVKKELMIFLTPYIVDSPKNYRDLSVEEANRSEILPDAFSPAEYDNALDTIAVKPGTKTAPPSFEAKRTMMVEPELPKPLPK